MNGHNKDRAVSGDNAQALTQLRMGLLGTVTAVVICFAAAFAFADTPSQATEAIPAPSPD